MMENTSINKYDIIISGAGVIGLIQALLLAKNNIKIALIESKSLKKNTQINNTRNIALMQPSLNVIKFLGIFNKFYIQARPLKDLYIIDITNSLLPAVEIKFSASELNMEYFALNIPIGIILKILCFEISKYKNITCLFNKQVKNLNHTNKSIDIILNNNQIINCKLLIGADGKNSIIRELSNIKIVKKIYEQKAISFIIQHVRDYGDISIEFYRKNGPFTLIPMKNTLNDYYQTSLIWSESYQESESIKKLSQKKLSIIINEITNNIMGKIIKINYITSFPLTSINCLTYAKNRIILIGDAAHVLPPIGAQGINLGFQDAATVNDLIITNIKNNTDFGNNQTMNQYNKQRILDINIRWKIFNILNISLLYNFIPLQLIRIIGLIILQKSKTIRLKLMKKILFPIGKLPTSMK